ncbi:hypothetical protein [Amycolatopsis australiensis]|nr:hypothetical protein [Amycolatopsis australiensis]
MTLAVDLAQRPGATLVVATGRPRPGNWLHLPAERSGRPEPPRPSTPR